MWSLPSLVDISALSGLTSVGSSVLIGHKLKLEDLSGLEGASGSLLSVMLEENAALATNQTRGFCVEGL